MDIEHPRDVDPSITGQPHQVTGRSSRPDGQHSRTLGNTVNMPAAVPIRYRRNPFPAPFAFRLPPSSAPRRAAYAAPRWSASQTAVDSRTPSSIERPQWVIQAATPSGVPEA